MILGSLRLPNPALWVWESKSEAGERQRKPLLEAATGKGHQEELRSPAPGFEQRASI